MTPQTSFGFHQAHLPQATATLWGGYAGDIEAWINAHGGLEQDFVWMRAPDFSAISRSAEAAPGSPRSRG